MVDNLVPALEVTHGDSFAGGVTQVNATLTDEGWLDTHSAVVDWGDGTTTPVDVTTGGAGWGTFFGSHVYRRAGSFDVVVTLTDDDGGSAVQRVDHLEVAEAAAVWANAPGSRSLDWAGGSGEIQGRVHTNGELRFVGAAKTVRGTTTYAGSIAADTTKNSFTPLPVKSDVLDFPMDPEVADFRPGGPVAVEVGTAYHDMSSLCSGGSWHDVQSVLASGVYYASCDIQLNGSQIGGRVTLVSEGHIKIAGSRPAFEPYRDGCSCSREAPAPRRSTSPPRRRSSSACSSPGPARSASRAAATASTAGSSGTRSPSRAPTSRSAEPTAAAPVAPCPARWSCPTSRRP